MLDTDLNNVLNSDQLAQLTETYWLRHPTEACGVITPSSHKGRTVFELPNRSMEPQSSYLMSGKDLNLELSEWFNEHGDELAGVIFWHTHPSGDPKPSKADRSHRVNGAMNLIVSFVDREGSIQLYWF